MRDEIREEKDDGVIPRKDVHSSKGEVLLIQQLKSSRALIEDIPDIVILVRFLRTW